MTATPDTPPVAPPEDPPAAKGTDRDAVLRETYVIATRRLRKAHLAEFNNYRVEEAKKRGIEWSPPLTADEKAREELDRLLAEHPTLLEDLADRVSK